MHVTVRKVGDVSILDLRGPLRIGEAEQEVREQVQKLLDGGGRYLAINLAGVPMIDSSGIGFLVRTHKTLQEMGGNLILFSPSKTVRRTLKMVGLDRFFGLYNDEASALAR